MPSSSGPKISSKESLVFAIDTYDTSNCVTPLGCGGFNDSTQGIKNILTGTTSLFQNGLRISNRDFYTAFGISYPESAYGGDAASRNGLTPGYNVRSGGKTYDASRSLHLWVWNNDTNTWVPDSFFRGLRLGGHCYDNWTGAESGWQNELNLFNGDVAIIKQAFPNSTWILCGSHACQMFDSTTINNMVDLGAPLSTISSWTDNSVWREFVLVGKPRLGNGNAYGWAYENYSTNPGQVAHMNLSVTPKALGVLDFDGTDDLLNTGSTPSSLQGNPNLTICGFFRRKSDQSYGGPWGIGGEATNGGINCWNFANTNEITIDTWSTSTFTSGVTFPLNQWVFAAWQKYAGPMTRANCILWRNLSSYTGNQLTVLRSEGPSPNINDLGITLGSISTNTGYCKNFEISKFQIYNTVLSTSEITQIYNQNKTRFNLP